MNGSQRAEFLLSRSRQGIECADLVCEEGVAASGRDVEGHQAGPGGRVLEKPPVGVPVLGEEQSLFIGLAQDRGNMLSPLDGFEEGILAEPADGAGKGFEGVVVRRLFEKSEDAMLEPGRTYLRGKLGINRTEKVEPGYACTARLAAWLDLQAHRKDLIRPARRRYSCRNARSYVASSARGRPGPRFRRRPLPRLRSPALRSRRSKLRRRCVRPSRP